MPEYSTSVPAPVIRQESEPDAANYYVWIKESTNEAFYSDGTDWTEIPTGGSSVSVAVIENALSILELQAADTITPDTSAQIASDVFSDANGYNNTINTTNTTAIHSGNIYTQNFSDEASGDTTSDPDTFSNVANAFDDNDTTYASDTGPGSNSLGKTFSEKNVQYVKVKAYKSRVQGGSATNTVVMKLQTFNGSTWDDQETWSLSNQSSSINNTIDETLLLDVTCQGIRVLFSHSGGESFTSTESRLYTLEYGSVEDSIIETNAISLPSTPANFLIFAFRKNETGTGSIDADISFDGGSNYQEGVALNTETAITNVGSSMILKLNLNAGASAGLAECEGYGVLFW